MSTIRRIEIFLQLAETLHFNRAAEELNISQAALSKEISKLEEELKCQLFDRSDKWNIRLTAAGKAYQAKVRSLPQQIVIAGESARRAARGSSGELAVSVANLVYDYIQLSDFFREMHRKYPDVKIIIRDCQSSPMVYEHIQSGVADIGFMAVNSTGNPLADLQKKPLMELPLHFAFPADHPLAHKSDLQIRDLANCNLILPPMGQAPWLRKYIEELFVEHCGKLPPVEQEALGLRATRQLVSAGLGIGLAIKPPVRNEQENIIYREIPLLLKRVIVAVWDNNNNSRILKNFARLLPRKK